MKKGICLFVIVLLAVWFNPANAQVRTPDQIRQIAREYFSGTGQRSQTRGIDTPFQIIPASAILNRSLSGGGVKSMSGEAFYVCVGEQRVVIVSGDDRMLPVLGYSDRPGFELDRIPPDMYWLLWGYATEFEALQRGAVRVGTDASASGPNFPDAVPSLLDSKGIAWAQEAPYNDQCPVIDGRRAVTGCVATAMAMVMMYHEYPSRGKGELAGMNLALYPLEWEGMKNLGTVTGRQAVAQLMLFCGLAVGSNYGLLETTAPGLNVLKGLYDYFAYSNGMQYVTRDAFLAADWSQMLKREVSQGRPVVYAGYTNQAGGHCFVLDGYDRQDLFHINWGWGGGLNGFYALTALRPGFSGPGSSMGGFNVGQGAIIGIKPATGESEYTSNFSGITSAMVLSKQFISRNASFDIARIVCVNYSTTFTGDIQPALFKDNQFVSTIGNPLRASQIPYRSAPGNVSFSNLTIPPEIPDGTYQLHMVTKDVRESCWQLMRMAQTEAPYYVVSITSSDITFTNPVNMNGLLMTAFERENNLYHRFGAGFKIAILNAGTEWMGFAGVQMQVTDQSKVPVVIAQDRLVFMPGENHFQLSEAALPLAKGEYTMQPVYSVNGVHWFPLAGSGEERVQVEVADLNGFNLLLTTCRPVRRSLTEKDRAGFELTIRNTGTGPFNDRIVIEIFNKKNPGLYYRLPDKELFIDKDQQVSVRMEYLSRLPDGDYLINLQYIHFLQGVKKMAESVCEFTVRSLSGMK